MARPKKENGDVKVKKTKKDKDPNAPKRPVSAYMLWLNANRSRLTKSGMSVTDVAKAAGAEWRTIEDKSKWEELYRKNKAQYEKDLEAYKGSA